MADIAADAAAQSATLDTATDATTTREAPRDSTAAAAAPAAAAAASRLSSSRSLASFLPPFLFPSSRLPAPRALVAPRLLAARDPQRARSLPEAASTRGQSRINSHDGGGSSSDSSSTYPAADLNSSSQQQQPQQQQQQQSPAAAPQRLSPPVRRWSMSTSPTALPTNLRGGRRCTADRPPEDPLNALGAAPTINGQQELRPAGPQRLQMLQQVDEGYLRLDSELLPATTTAVGAGAAPVECAAFALGGAAFVVYRAVLCSADCSQTQGSCEESTAVAAAAATAPPQLMRSAHQRSGTVRLMSLQQWQWLRDAAIAHPHDPLPGHTPLCKLVAAKTTTLLHPYQQQAEQLKYELAALQRAAAVMTTGKVDEQGAGSNNGQQLFSVYPSSSSSSSLSLPCLSTLPDGRTALLQRDPLGETLAQRNTQSRTQSSFIVSFSANPARADEQRRQPRGSSGGGGSGGIGCTGDPTFCITTLPLLKLMTQLRAVLAVSRSIAMALQRLHAAGLVHKALRPCNILLPACNTLLAMDGKTGNNGGRSQSSSSLTVSPSSPCSSSSSSSSSCSSLSSSSARLLPAATLLDLGASSLLPKEKAKSSISPYSHPLNEWLYLAPEQSGRTRAIIDNRTDLYTLGIIM